MTPNFMVFVFVRAVILILPDARGGKRARGAGAPGTISGVPEQCRLGGTPMVPPTGTYTCGLPICTCSGRLMGDRVGCRTPIRRPEQVQMGRSEEDTSE